MKVRTACERWLGDVQLLRSGQRAEELGADTKRAARLTAFGSSI
jgi:hypothetical protein